ncbi:uncharacterized membrane protein YjgN (DUF898 family) [Hoeflea marina]|uniref:Uncharacterized membrane protein YjgN (DUF898 family) n=2 Tax=Hoeflea marina TaxID=274592 RepID=A0A317PC58_9HYPH|nr:uncharacterized membrane protein YjgN (DUF898 family) [Hoeflea marina]
MGVNAAFSKRPRPERFSFTGSAGEYFRIWIVNLFLSIITIGLYSPWAKVRRLKYFYGNTWLDGHNFDYVADPKKILKGRLIVVGVLIVVNVLLNISPFFAVLFIPYIIAFPWMLNTSMAFNARNTVYRNVCFGFRGTYGGAFKSFILWPMGAAFTAYLLSPFMFQAINQYIGSNTRWGRAQFETVSGVGPYYANFGRTLLMLLLMLIAMAVAILVPVLLIELVAMQNGSDGSNAAGVWAGAASVIIYPAMLGLIFYHGAGVRNIAFNSTLLDGRYRLKSRLGRGRYLWIMVTNLIATVLSLGLLRAWAATRTWAYLADHTALEIDGDLESVIDAAQSEGNVAAAEYFDIEGMDFGL